MDTLGGILPAKWEDGKCHVWLGETLGWKPYAGFKTVKEYAVSTQSEPVSRSQVGGSHYTSMAIQPYEYCLKNNLGPCETNAISYLSRWKAKGGIQDLEKAVHTIQILIEYERAKVD